jgi:hypothetical protein
MKTHTNRKRSAFWKDAEPIVRKGRDRFLLTLIDGKREKVRATSFADAARRFGYLGIKYIVRR